MVALAERNKQLAQLESAKLDTDKKLLTAQNEMAALQKQNQQLLKLGNASGQR
jgi:hypothetical protein